MCNVLLVINSRSDSLILTHRPPHSTMMPAGRLGYPELTQKILAHLVLSQNRLNKTKSGDSLWTGFG